MKINITHNKLTKSLLLASATLALSLSSAHAANYSSPDNGTQNYTNITDLSGGTISIGSSSFLTFKDSSLSTFNVTVLPSGGGELILNNTSLHLSDFNNVYTAHLKVTNNSSFNVVSGLNLNTGSLSISDSTFYAPNVKTYDFYMTNASTTFRGDISNMNLNSGATWNALEGSTVNYLYVNDNASLNMLGSLTVNTLTVRNNATVNATSDLTFTNLYVGNNATVITQDGKIIDYADLSNNSTLKVMNSIYFQNLYLSDSTINLVLNSPYSIPFFASELYTSGNNVIKYDFTDAFIEEIMNDYNEEYPYTFSVTYAFIVGTTEGDGTWAYDIASSSDSYTWTVTHIGGGFYRFSDITLIPEPSTYALIFGAMALGLAIYRRRK